MTTHTGLYFPGLHIHEHQSARKGDRECPTVRREAQRSRILCRKRHICHFAHGGGLPNSKRCWPSSGLIPRGQSCHGNEPIVGAQSNRLYHAPRPNGRLGGFGIGQIEQGERIGEVSGHRKALSSGIDGTFGPRSRPLTHILGLERRALKYFLSVGCTINTQSILSPSQEKSSVGRGSLFWQIGWSLRGKKYSCLLSGLEIPRGEVTARLAVEESFPVWCERIPVFLKIECGGDWNPRDFSTVWQAPRDHIPAAQPDELILGQKTEPKDRRRWAGGVCGEFACVHIPRNQHTVGHRPENTTIRAEFSLDRIDPPRQREQQFPRGRFANLNVGECAIWSPNCKRERFAVRREPGVLRLEAFVQNCLPIEARRCPEFERPTSPALLPDDD